MTSPTRDDVARRAGIDPGYLERLIELGIVPAEGDLTSGDIRRAQLAKTLDTAGIAPEDLAEVLSTGTQSLDFMDTPRCS